MRERLIKTVKDRLGNKNGFTLIELMATLVILALIIAIAVPAIGKLVTQADESADKSSIALMERAGEMAELDGLKFDDAAPVNTELHPSITEKDVYMIPTLIEQGYLKLDEKSKFNEPENYVKKVNKSGKFVYMGKGTTAPPVTTPGDGDGDDWVSKYRPFVTAELTAQRDADSLGSIFNMSFEYGAAACERWHEIAASPTDDCTQHYKDIFDAAMAKYDVRASVNQEFTQMSVMRPGMACLYERATGSMPPAGSTVDQFQGEVMAYAMSQGDAMAWVSAQTDCVVQLPGGTMMASPAILEQAVEDAKLAAMIDEVVLAMDINNDKLPGADHQ